MQGAPPRVGLEARNGAAAPRIARALRAITPLAVAACAAWLAHAAPDAPAAWRPPLDHPPLDPPLVLTSDFGEARGTHFHAGLDFSTGGAIGREVFAPRDGRIVRVRTSGVGYGRSLYMESSDGLLFVFGHLDAFEEPLASWVAAMQESSGRYEQDLWPDPARFPVRAGTRIAWSGESGVGPPHLHLEIRRGDMAYNPLRAGVVVGDSMPPAIRAITLEPLDAASRVEESPGPKRFAVTGADTLTVRALGRLRVLVDARDARGDGVQAMAPWSIAMEGGGGFVVVRFDSASWAGDMADAAIAYDRGRALGPLTRNAVPLWSEAGHRARVLHTDRPDAEEAGVVTVRPGDSPQLRRIEVRDLAGHVTARVLRVVPSSVARMPARAEGAADTPIGGVRANFRFEPLAGRALRVVVSGGPRPAAGTAAWVRAGGWTEARYGARGWSAVTPPIDSAVTTRLVLEAAPGVGARPAWRALGPEVRLVPVRETGVWRDGRLTWRVETDDLFGPAVFVASQGEATRPTSELVPVRGWVALGPETQALRGAIEVGMAPPGGADLRHVGLYVGDDAGWALVSATFDSTARAFTGTTRALGRFVLMRDTMAPRIAVPRALRHGANVPYNRWAVEARVTELGSGIDTGASHIEFDGRVVPTEWDADRRTLRWRPLKAPARGAHEAVVVAVDQAGNRARRSARFVLE